MALLDSRLIYYPFEYEEAYNFWLQQQQAHWLHSEISMARDINDWQQVLSEEEKRVIGGILKSFTQTEIVIGNEYWIGKVHKWFQKPEIQMMAAAFGNMETIHTKSYAYLNESLGLYDFAAFLKDPAGKAKIDKLIDTKGDSVRDIALSLAVFSAFGEGVQLFSSFAILLNYSRFNKMKGVGEIITFSARDESLHSAAGCWLFRQLVKEYPDVLNDDLKSKIYQAARDAVKLEIDYIDSIFPDGKPVLDLDPKDLKEYIKHRANTKLHDLGLKTNWKNLDKEAISRLNWFDYLTAGENYQDFFAGRVADYSKGVVEWSVESIFG